MDAHDDLHTFIARLQSKPEIGNVLVIRVTNKLSTPLDFQIEPSGEMTEPLQPDDHYVVVSQDKVNEYGTLDIDVGDGSVRVWVEGMGGWVFHKGKLVASSNLVD